MTEQDLKDLKVRVNQLTEELLALEDKQDKIDKQTEQLEDIYLNTVINAGAMIKHLDDLGKIAGQFNRTSQRMNVGYFLLQAIGQEVNVKKKGDPTEIQRVSIWTTEQSGYIRDFLYEDVIVKLREGDE